MSDQPDVPTEDPDVRSLRVAAAIVAAYAANGRPHLVATANRVDAIADRMAAGSELALVAEPAPVRQGEQQDPQPGQPQQEADDSQDDGRVHVLPEQDPADAADERHEQPDPGCQYTEQLVPTFAPTLRPDRLHDSDLPLPVSTSLQRSPKASSGEAYEGRHQQSQEQPEPLIEIRREWRPDEHHGDDHHHHPRTPEAPPGALRLATHLPTVSGQETP